MEDDSKDKQGGMTRVTGEPEFTYETNLFRKHAKRLGPFVGAWMQRTCLRPSLFCLRCRFEQLNMMVRLRVMANLGLPRKVKGCREKDPALRGMSLNQLRVVSAKLEASCPWTPLS